MFTLDRTVILHPEAERVMKKELSPEFNQIFEQAAKNRKGRRRPGTARGDSF